MPQIAALASLGWPPRLLAARRTREERPSHPDRLAAYGALLSARDKAAELSFATPRLAGDVLSAFAVFRVIRLVRVFRVFKMGASSC